MARQMLLFGFMMMGLLLFGCAGNRPVAPTSNNVTFNTGVGTGAQNVVALPVAIEGQPYAAGIEPEGGAAPYICESVPAGSMIIGTIALGADCVIRGDAPMLSPGTTHGIYPVKFIVIDANGARSGPFDLALEIVKAEGQQQGGQQGAVVPSGNQLALDLPAELPSAHGGEDYNYSPRSGGGNASYWFSVKEGDQLPDGLYIEWQNGTILGKTQLHDKDTNYSFTLCVHDNMGAESCKTTSLTVLSTSETWSGTIQTSRPICSHGARPGIGGSGYDYDSSLAGSWTTTFTVPVNLAEALATPPNYMPFASAGGVWSGSESPTGECQSWGLYSGAVGGSASDVPILMDVYTEPYENGKVIRLVSKDYGVKMMTGGVIGITYGKEEGRAEIMLIPTSISDDTVSGNVLMVYPYLNGSGTFTLTKVK